MDGESMLDQSTAGARPSITLFNDLFTHRLSYIALSSHSTNDQFLQYGCSPPRVLALSCTRPHVCSPYVYSSPWQRRWVWGTGDEYDNSSNIFITREQQVSAYYVFVLLSYCLPSHHSYLLPLLQSSRPYPKFPRCIWPSSS